MAINQETRISKNDTFEDWRQKDNEISIHVGDTALLDSKLTDKEYSTTAGAGDYIFAGTRFELSQENNTDNTSGAIILKSGPTMTGFVANATVYQGSNLASADWSATIVSVIGSTKIYVKGATGTFNAAAAIKAASSTIAAANVSRLISEAYPVGVIRVYKGASELPQTLTAGGFHVANYQGDINLTGSPSIPASFTEGCSLYQGSNLASATWSGTLHSVVGTTKLRLKTSTGSFDAGEILKVDGNTGASNQIAAAKLTSLTVVDYSYGSLIELHTAASASDVIKIDASSLVYAVNEVQDDIGEIASFTTSNKSNVVAAVNELDAELGTITAGAMGTSASTVSTAIAELENEIDVLNARVEPTQAFNGTFTSSTIMDGINELMTDIGDVTAGNMGTTASTVVGAINEVENEVDALNLRVEPTQAFAGTFSSSTIMDALNEHEGDIGNMTFTGLSATDISAAIRELQTEKIGLNNGAGGEGNQTINSDLTFTSGNTMTFPSGSVLNISAGSLIMGGGAGSTQEFDTAFLVMKSSASQEGIQIDRSEISGASVNTGVDAQLFWDESQVGTGSGNQSHRAWRLKGLSNPSSGTPATSTSSIVTFYNAKDLITNNSESGIDVTWDNTNQNFDFNVADWNLTIDGDMSGTANIANLNNTTITSTLDTVNSNVGTFGSTTAIPVITANAKGLVTAVSTATIATSLTVDGDSGSQDVALLTDDLQIIGTTNEIETAVTKSGTDVKVTVGLPTNVTIAGNLTVSGTTTTVNSNTVNIGDNMLVLNSDETGTPSEDAGFEIERGSSTNAKFYWDESADRFVVDEADGVERQITRAGDTVFTIAGNSGSEAVTVGYGTLNIAGTGDIATAYNSGSNTLTITNNATDANSLGRITVTDTDSGYSWSDTGTLAADAANDVATFVSGVGIEVDVDAGSDAVRISHADTSSQASVDNSNGTVIQDITLDTNGHITGLASYDLDNRYSTNPVNLTGNQTIAGTKTFSSTISGSISGSSTSCTGNAATVTNGVYTTGNQTIAGTKTFSSTIHGSINGNADSASKIYITADNTATNNSYPIPIASAGGSANRTLFEDDNLTYNPTTNTLYTSVFSGSHSGNGANLTSLNASQLTTGTIPAARVPTLNQNTTGSSGSCTGNAATASDVYQHNSDGNGNYRILWTTATSSGNDNVYHTGGVTLNASSNQITASQFNGALVGNVTGNVSGSSGSCTGNAASVTGGVYTSGNQTIAGTKTFSSTISGSINGNAGTATWADTVDVNNNNNAAANYYAVWHSGDTLYSTNGIYFHPGNNYVYATDFIASSDERLKNRIGNLDNALDKVCSLDGFLYTWNDQAESEDKETVQVGVSAQQVQEVLPEAVNENDNGYLGVKYDKLVPLLIESIKELKSEIEELKRINSTE